MDGKNPARGVPAKVRTFQRDMAHAQSPATKEKNKNPNETVPVMMPQVFSSTPEKNETDPTVKKKGSLLGGIFKKKQRPKALKKETTTGHVQELVPKETPKPKLSAEELLKQPVKPGKIQNESILAEEDRLFDIKSEQAGAADGTIVNETKRKRWSLSGEIGKSVSKWVNNLVYEPVTTEKKGVEKKTNAAQVQKKRSDTKKTSLEKVRTLQADAARITGKPNVKAPKKKDGVAEEKTEIKELRSINKRPVNVEEHDASKVGTSSVFKKIFPPKPSIKSSRRVRSMKQPAPKAPKNVIAKDTRTAVAPNATRRTSGRKILRDVERQPIDLTMTSEKPSISDPQIGERSPSRDTPFELPTFQKKQSLNYRTLREDAIEDVEEKQLSVAKIASAEAKRRTKRREEIDLQPARNPLIPAITIIGVLLILGGAGFAFIQMREQPQETDIAARIPSFIHVKKTLPIPFSSDRNALLAALTIEKDRGREERGSVIQLYPDVSTTSVPIPASTIEIMEVLDIRAPGSFIRSLLENMQFGFYVSERNEAFMIMRSGRFDTAFAGMLEWEPFMSADLTPFFGEVVRRTLDPTARTIDQSGEAHFVDDIIRNRDVRILYNELGEEQIIYSFVDQETILITTSPEAFVAIVESFR